jgi:hypothetical protein
MCFYRRREDDSKMCTLYIILFHPSSKRACQRRFLPLRSQSRFCCHLFHTHRTIPASMSVSAQKLRLPSGRTLDYIVTGSTKPDALAFVYIHGTPSAYPVMKALITGCEKHNFKLISFSRAGYGDSSRDAGRSVINIVEDVRSLLAHLDVKQCVVGGWSGGGEWHSDEDCKGERRKDDPWLMRGRTACRPPCSGLCSEARQLHRCAVYRRRGTL